jgi:hypothetical protein
LCEHFELLEAGRWPQEPSNYIDPAAMTLHRLGEGQFTKPHEVLVVLLPRLLATKKDGDKLLYAAQFGKSYNQLDQDEKNALAYCSGMKDKAMPYSVWLAKRKYRKKACV